MKAAPLLAFLVIAVTARALPAQQAGSLERVDSLARAGRAGEARTALDRWWRSAWSSAPRQDRERALWLRGRLTRNPEKAELDFERLVVEYPGGTFTNLALFRLAQEAFVAGDTAGVHRRLAALEQNYPGSQVTREAKSWLQGAGSPPPPAAPEPVESKATKAASESPSRKSAAPAQSARPATRDGTYAVQLGAFGDVSRARALASRARKAGLDVRIVRVPGSGLVRVRTGRFDSAQSAQDLLKRVERLGFPAALVRSADHEERVR